MINKDNNSILMMLITEKGEERDCDVVNCRGLTWKMWIKAPLFVSTDKPS